MKILMLDSSTYGEDVNVDKFYGLGEVKSYQTSTRQEALERIIMTTMLNQVSMQNVRFFHIFPMYSTNFRERHGA